MAAVGHSDRGSLREPAREPEADEGRSGANPRCPASRLVRVRCCSGQHLRGQVPPVLAGRQLPDPRQASVGSRRIPGARWRGRRALRRDHTRSGERAPSRPASGISHRPGVLLPLQAHRRHDTGNSTWLAGHGNVATVIGGSSDDIEHDVVSWARLWNRRNAPTKWKSCEDDDRISAQPSH